MVVVTSFFDRMSVACLLASLFAITAKAQHPDPPVLQLPKTPIEIGPGSPDDPVVRRAIEALLRGDSDVDVPEPMLEDFGRFIRGRKSVLAGSILEQMSDSSDDEPIDPPALGRAPAGSKETNKKFRWRTAELLLKSARMLEKVRPNDQNQIKLVNQMRRQAVSMMMGLLEPNESDAPRELPATVR